MFVVTAFLTSIRHRLFYRSISQYTCCVCFHPRTKVIDNDYSSSAIIQGSLSLPSVQSLIFGFVCHVLLTLAKIIQNCENCLCLVHFCALLQHCFDRMGVGVAIHIELVSCFIIVMIPFSPFCSLSLSLSF